MNKLTLLTALCLTLSANAAQTCNNDIMATTPVSHFTINADNTVTDNTTGLTWMRCSLGQTGSDCSSDSAKSYTWAEALNEVAKNHNGWRLPNIKELASIVEFKCYDPIINTTIFPNTQSNTYWSSSPYAFLKNYVWGIDFGRGGTEYYNKSTHGVMRLVRNEQ